MSEQELREQIAKDIEEWAASDMYNCECVSATEKSSAYLCLAHTAAAIARGNK